MLWEMDGRAMAGNKPEHSASSFALATGLLKGCSSADNRPW